MARGEYEFDPESADQPNSQGGGKRGCATARPPHLRRRTRRSALRDFLCSEALGGIVLVTAFAAGLLAANSPLAPAYFGVLESHLRLSLLHWINDGLMAPFFLLVGLEVKRELIDGKLSSRPRRILPGLAALGAWPRRPPSILRSPFVAGSGARMGDTGGYRHRLHPGRPRAAGCPSPSRFS